MPRRMLRAGWRKSVAAQPLESLEPLWRQGDRLQRRPAQTAQRVNRLADHQLHAGGMSAKRSTLSYGNAVATDLGAVPKRLHPPLPLASSPNFLRGFPMLHDREIATLRAALRYWSEEMTPHGEEVMQPYYKSKATPPLTTAETFDLLAALDAARQRYALVDATGQRCAVQELFLSAEAAKADQPADSQVALVLLPGSRER